MSSTKSNKVVTFHKAVWSYYRTHGRNALPWRKTRNPYLILVSEIMLQQTQVERVVPYYTKFVTEFPNVETLARAPLARVLTVWQGLGYNRRAKMLHEAAKQIVGEYQGTFPKQIEQLESLRGVGPYTARAVAAFAYNNDVIFIETNIRTVVIHHFFPKKEKVSDADIEKILVRTFPKGKAREWYSALMDYGAYLKRSGVRTNTRVKGYAKQSTFKGSVREARGAILRALHKKPQTITSLLSLLGEERVIQMQMATQRLLQEGLLQRSRGLYHLPE